MTAVDGSVFVIDDDEGVRKALRRVLSAAGFRVEAFPSSDSWLAHPQPSGPVCLVLDQNLPGPSGLDLQEQLAGTSRSPAVVFLTGYGDVPLSVRAMKAGAVDFLTKPVDDEALIDAVQRGLSHHASRLESSSEREAFGRLVSSLSDRERQVCFYVVRGLLNKQIAGELGIAEKTVKIHRGHMIRKLQVGSVAELSRLFERTGLIDRLTGEAREQT